ncbi:hypothetical protein CYMTET_10276 [Cymbomonas tetramitiformis]|uniref:Beta-lactamase-related domain-containing protein n=1 Tax=Cymbomonas tetramitiformis TaxID=36881 RepID=A0AAE0LEB9_9CHLO|nr:hypothetical protein CYMTET_10276 [Cymbomonas tetramitiformis]
MSLGISKRLCSLLFLSTFILNFSVVSTKDWISRRDTFANRLQWRLQALLEDKAQYYNVSFSAAIRTNNRTVLAAAGVNDQATGERVSIHSLFPSGSITKCFTAVGILQLVEEGAFGLDDALAPLVDKALLALHNTTVGALWNNDPRVQQITVRHVLGMQSGLQDYDDPWVFNFTLNHPTTDLTPIMYLKSANKTFKCDPGHCGSYSSLGYELLGYALVQAHLPHLTGASSWKQYDQLSAIPEPLRSEMKHILFPVQGLCAAYIKQGLVHQYSSRDYKNFFDLMNTSCLNGWTFGNIAAAPSDTSNFFLHLFGSERVIVKNRTLVEEMSHFLELQTGWGIGLPYGLGLEHIFYPVYRNTSTNISIFGHGGIDYGSMAEAGYLVDYDFAFGFATNSISGMSNALSKKQNGHFWFDIKCNALQIALEEIGKGEWPVLDCSLNSLEMVPRPPKDMITML